jgi:hypothetical protein
MSKSWSAIVAIALCGCATSGPPQYCALSSEQKEAVLENVRHVIAELTDEQITFDLPSSVVNDSRLYKTKGRCWAYLSPRAVQPGHGILDGDGGVYINASTLKSEGVFWFAY